MNPTYIKFTDDEGNVLVEEELIYMDRALARSQAAVKFENLDSDVGMKTWLPIFAEYLSDLSHSDETITESQAYMIAQEIVAKATELKKKFSPLLTSRESIVSTPLDSTSENGTG